MSPHFLLFPVSIGSSAPSPISPVAPVPSPVRAPSPVSMPAPAPVKAPTPTLPAPTTPSAVSSPVKMPVPTSPTTSAGCCSQNFKTCINWCGTTKAECLKCSSDVTWLSSGSLQNSKCVARWGTCNQAGQKCCPGLVCKRQSQWYSQCSAP